MPWKTSDYIDLLTPFMAGNQIYQQNRSRKLQEEEARVREAQVAHQMGVEPVRGANGGIDWDQTAKIAKLQEDADAIALGIGQDVGLGKITELTPEQKAISNRPAFQKGRTAAALVKYQRDAQIEAAMQRIVEEGKLRQDIAKENAASRKDIADQNRIAQEAWRSQQDATRRDLANTETETIENPDGSRSVIRRPVSSGKRSEKLQQSDPIIAKIEQAIQDTKLAESSGRKIDIKRDNDNLPKVVTSHWYWGWGHDATPSRKESYGTQIAALEEELRLAKEALGYAPKTKKPQKDYLSHESVQGASSNSVRNAPQLDVYKYR